MRLRALAACMAISFLALGMAQMRVNAGTTGTIQGVVKDHKTGQALSGVNISIGKTRLTTVTDANGAFAITNVPPGTYDLTASLVGYKDTTEEAVAVLMDVTSVVEVALSVEVIEKSTTVVTGSRVKLSATVTPTMYVVTPKEESIAAHQPNNLYQLPGILLTLPGVVADPKGYPTIRGGDMWYVGYTVEGIPITEPITNGFATNTVTAGLSKAELFTGGYRPEYGNSLAGMINQVIKTGDQVTAPGKDIGGSLDFSGGGATYRSANMELGGTSIAGGTWYTAATFFRTEFPGNDNLVSAPYSADSVSKFVLPVGKKDNLTFLALHGAAKYDIWGEINQTYDSATDSPKDINRQSAFTTQSYAVDSVSFSHNIQANSFVNLRLYRVHGDGTYNTLLKETDPDHPANPFGAYRTRESTQNGIQFDYTNQISDKHLLKTGVTSIKSSNFSMKYADGWGLHEHFTNNVPALQSAFYIQDQYRADNRFMLDYGLRYERMHFDRAYHADLTDSQTSPRVGATYTLNDKTLLRSSWGRFIMFPPTSLLESHFDDPSVDAWYNWGDLKPERSSTMDFGVERKLTNSLLGKATLFRTQKTDQINYTFTNDGQVQFVNGFKGKSNGLELQIQSKPKDGWNGWISYTYLNATASTVDSPDVFNRLPQDQRHTLALVATRTFKGIEVSPYIEYGSGYPYGDGQASYDPTPGADGDEIPIIGPDGKPGSTVPNCYTAPAHLDFSLMLRKPLSADSSIYLAVQNILNSNSVTVYTTTGPSSFHNPDADHPNGYLTYEPYQRVPARFLRVGYSHKF